MCQKTIKSIQKKNKAQVKPIDLFYKELSWNELREMWSKSQHGLG